MTTAAEATAPYPPLATSPNPALDAAYNKVAWRLLPFLMVLWILAWIDRVPLETHDPPRNRALG